MRISLVLILSLFFCYETVAQKNYAKEFQSAKWYQDNSSPKNAEKKLMIFKKINGKVNIKEITTFYADGHVKRCFFETEGLNPSGVNSCDSSFTYQIKKDLIHISDHELMHLYYKIKPIENGLELKPVEPELFYKK